MIILPSPLLQSKLALFLLIRIVVVTVRAHSDNSYLEILDLITSAKVLLPYKVTFIGSTY